MTISRRHTLQLVGAATVAAAAGTSPLAPAPVAMVGAEAAAPPAHDTGATGDYELTINLDFDFQDYSDARHRVTYGRYTIAAGREDGAWRMLVMRVLAEDPESGEDIHAEPFGYNVDGQTAGPDPLALLHALLGGQTVHDGTRYVRDLSPTELAALRHASPELRAELLALMQRHRVTGDDRVATWFGRWALTASARELDGFSYPDPAYMALAGRVKAERLAAKVLAERAATMAATARELAAWAEHHD